MENLAVQNLVLVHALRREVPVRAPDEAEVPLSGLVHGDDGHGGVLLSGAQSPAVHAVVLQHLAEVRAESVVPHLAQEGGFRPQPGGGHRHVGGRPAGVGGKLRHAGLIDPSLGQVD